MSFRCAILFLLCLSVFLVIGISYAGEGQYPIKVEIIDKDQAIYDTPENTFAAGLSALIKGDLEWYYDTLTKESAEKDKKDFEDSNIDPNQQIEAVKNFNKTYIINKKAYKHAILLIVESHGNDGAIMTGPSFYIKENGLWKTTFEFATDEEIWDYMDYTPPPILTASTKIHPKRWSLDLYNWINDHLETSNLPQFLSEKLTILCLIRDLRDSEGKSYSVNDIIRESIRLNEIVPPQTYKLRGVDKIASILNSGNIGDLKTKKGFKQWHSSSSFIRNSKKPVIMLRFNMFKSMGTLTGMNPDEEYDIEITGRLKNKKTFKGTAKIRLRQIKKGEKKELKNNILFNAEKQLHNWWNHEPNLEKRWVSIKNGKTD